MRRGKTRGRLFPLAVLATCALPAAAGGQQTRALRADTLDCTRPSGGDANRPFAVCQVRAPAVHGPYVVAPTDTSAVVVWATDVPAAAKVLFAEVAEPEDPAGPAAQGWPEGLAETVRTAEPDDAGLAPVGTLHRVRLTGLRPGRTWAYRVVATPVVTLRGYWPDMGLETVGEPRSFRTPDPAADAVVLALVTDTHEDPERVADLAALVDGPRTDLLVHLGDAFDVLDDEAELWGRWLDPLVAGGMGAGTPLLYVRGNHEARGAFARALPPYVTGEEGRFHYARDLGPLHLVVLDTGEDKADSTRVYAGLDRMAAYRARELAWFRDHVRTSRRHREAPLRVLLLHQPDFGWSAADPDGGRVAWEDVAREAGFDLVVAGHEHRLSWTPAGESPLGAPLLVLGQDQVARLEATPVGLAVRVTGRDGVEVGVWRVEAGR